ncbi:PDZ domain-containing protein [Sulfolobus sp. E5-1-F]|uniref:site-2 protease family protein n=1 Tax=Sulfolobaceae TaxID=118883 RepID=UPI0012951A97|nr:MULTISPECIES: site-2 protease family protein [unclassified Sulfolobus]QGA55087.1 PDZ domain-containing protein [Sulfolobus sp. E5-1-F]QGA67896.1 PDZ domain-containing protein [Sulfolobus sp. E11-6]
MTFSILYLHIFLISKYIIRFVDQIYLAVTIFLSFWLIIYILRRKLEKYNLTVYPFFILWRKKAREYWFPKFSRSKGYRIYEKIALPVGFLLMIAGISTILYVIVEMLTIKPNQTPTIALKPIIPGLTISISQLPYILLAIGVSVAIHEIFHALSATSNNVKVKNGGVLLLGIFPGAFVEPDEDDFNKSTSDAKLKIIAAGIVINLVLALIALPLSFELPYLPSSLSQGIIIEGIVNGSPAANASIHAGDVIYYINGYRVTTLSQLHQLLYKYNTVLITLKHPNGTLSNVTVNIPDHLLGVYVTYYIPDYLVVILTFFTWLFIVNFSLAVFNAAPLIITDGGKLFTELLKRVLGERNGEKISYYLQSLFLLIFIFAIFLSNRPLG